MIALNDRLKQNILADYLRTSVLNDASNNYIVFSYANTPVAANRRATISTVVSNGALVVPVLALRTAVARMFYAIRQSEVSSQPSGTVAKTYDGVSYWAKAFTADENGSDLFNALIIESLTNVALNASAKSYNSISLVSGTNLTLNLYEQGSMANANFASATIVLNEFFSTTTKIIAANAVIPVFTIIMRL